MGTMLDGVTPGIRCPNCGAAVSGTVADLKLDPTITCSKCGAITTIDLDTSELDAVAQSINAMIDENAGTRPGSP